MIMNLEQKKDLLNLAAALSREINQDRFEGNVPDAEATVRLCEILDILSDQIDSECWAEALNDITCQIEV
jgi:hypothetical protein